MKSDVWIIAYIFLMLILGFAGIAFGATGLARACSFS